MWLMALTAAGMGFNLLVDIVIALKFGISQFSDALIISLVLPLFIDTVFREGTKFSLMPLFIDKMHRLSKPQYGNYTFKLFVLSAGLGVLLGVLVFFLSSPIINAIGPGLEDSFKSQAIAYLRILSLSIIIIPANSILGVVLNSSRKFNVVGTRNIVYSLSVLIFVFAFWNSDSLPEKLCLGYVTGFWIYFVFLVLASKIKIYPFNRSLWISKEEFNELFEAFSWPTFGFVARNGARVLEKSIASTVGAGGIAAYHFAFRIFSAIQTVVGTSIATVAMPDMANAKGNQVLLSQTLRRRLLTTMGLLVPVVILLLIGSETIMTIVYSRGKFSESDVQLTSAVMNYLAPGLFFVCLMPIYNSVLYILNAHRWVFLNMLTLAITNVLLAFFLSKSMGLPGIGLSVSLTTVLGNILSVFLLRQKGIKILA
jgi:murein biosynthesis integral membrane protein MurJ